MLVAQKAGPQRLERVPEPSQVTDAAQNVVQYNRVMTTKLVLAYAVGLEIVHRAQSELTGGSAVDLACGPGHYTLCLARYLGYMRVIGVDLSPPMVALATQNAAAQNLTQDLRFQVGDVTRLGDFHTGEWDLASFTDAAHHMPDLHTVGCVLREMDRITKPEGLIMVMDLARLRTARLTERYVNTLGHDYVMRGLPQFFEDFRNSMYAAWSVRELHQAVPDNSRRYWCHLVPRGLPSIQVILGLPVGRKKIFVRSGFPWPPEQNPVPADMRGEWKMMRWTVFLGSKALTAPRHETDLQPLA
jgi:ubiquinone/menaquinone biosynthesis C-methylase UbiE